MWSVLAVLLLSILFKKYLFTYISLMIMSISLILSFNLWPILSKNFFLDKISKIFILLVFVMMGLCFFLNEKINLLILMGFLYLFFSTSNLFLFYLFFELSMFPAFFLMYTKGLNPERLNALTALVIYTVLGSFPLAFMLFSFSKDMFLLQKLFSFKGKVTAFNNPAYIMFFILAFLMKLPLMGMHYWLPKAHVEAPTMGSMVLAALLLKMGSYGLFRLDLSNFSKSLSSSLIAWVIFFLVIVSFLCFRLADMKKLMAYSSVNHMLLVAFSWTLLTQSNIDFSMLLNMSHGFISSGLFLMMGAFYEKTNSRKIFFNTSLHHFFSLNVVFWFALLMANCSAPTSLSLYSEMFLFSSLLKESFSGLSLLIFVFCSGLYCISLYINSSHGDKNFSLNWSNRTLIYSLNAVVHSVLSFFFLFFLASVF